MTRLRKLTLCLTMTVWALLAPVTAGAALLDQPRLPADWSWPEPVAGLQGMVQGWLAVLFGPSGVPGVEGGDPGEDDSSIVQAIDPSEAAGSWDNGRRQLHPDFDPNG